MLGVESPPAVSLRYRVRIAYEQGRCIRTRKVYNTILYRYLHFHWFTLPSIWCFGIGFLSQRHPLWSLTTSSEISSACMWEQPWRFPWRSVESPHPASHGPEKKARCAQAAASPSACRRTPRPWQWRKSPRRRMVSSHSLPTTKSVRPRPSLMWKCLVSFGVHVCLGYLIHPCTRLLTFPAFFSSFCLSICPSSCISVFVKVFYTQNFDLTDSMQGVVFACLTFSWTFLGISQMDA